MRHFNPFPHIRRNVTFSSNCRELPRHSRSLLLVKRINLIGFELPRRHFLSEKHIEILEGSSLGFRKAEESPDESQQSRAAPNEAGVSLQVPLSRVHEIWFQNSGDHTDEVVGVASKTNGFLTKTGRAHFGRKSPAELSNGKLEYECPGESEHCLSHTDSVIFRLDVQDSNEEENQGHSEHSPEIDGAATEVGHEEEPGNQSANQSHRCSTDIQLVSCLRLESDLLEEVGGVISKAGSG